MTGYRMRMAALIAVIVVSRPCVAADLSGNWIAQIATTFEPQYTRVSFEVKGTTVTGMWGDLKINGSFTADKLDIKLTNATGNPSGELSGTWTGDKVAGVGNVRAAGAGGGGRGGGGGGGGRNAAQGPANFVLVRPVAPPANPRTINFEPKNFYATYSWAN